MKDRSTSGNRTKLTSGENLKSRIIIIVASVLAFAAALVIYLLLNLDDKADLMANDLEGIGEEPTVEANVDYPYVPGRILLRIRPEYRAQCLPGEIDLPGIRAAFQELGVTRVRKNFPASEPIIGEQYNDLGQQLVDLSLIYEVECDTAADIRAATRRLAGHPAVVYAEPRYIYETFLATNDLYREHQWFLDTMHVPAAWDQTTGDTNVVIAIIDTGTDFGHDDLNGDRIAYNYNDPIDGVDNDNDGYVDNFQGWDFGGTSFWAPADNDPNWVGTGPGMDHGVIVTGVACAKANNGKGIAGAGYNTRYLPLKASVDQSLGISYGMDAIVYAADHGADMLNLSWGSGAFSQYGQDICNYAAVNHGCLLVGAAGNQHTNIFYYPASYENVLSTSAMQTAYVAWNTNTSTGTSYNYLVDICAPGRNLVTTTGGNSYWGGATGTSMAAPLVCALAALVKARYPQYTNIQAGEIVRTTATDIYPTNPTLVERLGKGQADALAAVAAITPKSVRLDEFFFYDGNNGIPESFDTLEIAGRFVNHLSPTTNLIVDISSPNTEYIEVITGTQTLGNVGPSDTATNQFPFLIHLKRNVTEPTKLWLRFGFTDGNYTDYQYRSLIIYPTMIDLDANRLKTTINGVGNIGFVDYPGLQNGLGLRYDNNYNVLRDAGFLVGISQTNVVDMNRNEVGARDEDMSPLIKPYRTSGPRADLEARTRFEDSNSGTQMIGIDVEQHAFQFTGTDKDQFIILEYTVRNTNNYPVNGAYAGISAEWNRAYYNLSNANFYPNLNGIAANFTSGPTDFYTGIALLTDQSVYSYTTPEFNFSFSSEAKFDALRYNSGPQTALSGDVLQFISAGPFNLQPGDSAVVAFALLGGDNLLNLEEVAETARLTYHCELQNRKPSLSLGADVVICDPNGFPQLTANASPDVQYAWSTGDTSSSILAVNPGDYSVTVTNGYGCTATDTVRVLMKAISGYTIISNNLDFQTGAPVGFEVPDPNNVLTTWSWDFGDGSTSTDPSPNHIYSDPGTYTVTVTVGNGFCTETISYTVIVDVTTAVGNGFAEATKFFPNPVTDRLRFRLEYDYLGEVSIQLFDNSGKEVRNVRTRKNAFSLQTEIDVAELPAGFYLAKVQAGEFKHSDKIIKR